jgi:hypothetical protein
MTGRCVVTKFIGYVLVVLFIVAAIVAAADDRDEAKGKPVEYTVYTAYFEKNTSGLKGATSFLCITDQEAFDKIFQARPPLMGGEKPKLLPNDAFEKHIVAAAILRGDKPYQYKTEKVTADDGTLYVRYQAKATGDDKGTAKFASPLVITVPKEKYKSIVFIANGKKAGTAEAGK